MRRYFAELNRSLGDNIRLAARRLRRLGLIVEILAHKTSLRIERPKDVSWADFKRALRSVMNPRRGSILLFSERTGRTFICNNAGNRPGKFERQ